MSTTSFDTDASDSKSFKIDEVTYVITKDGAEKEVCIESADKSICSYEVEESVVYNNEIYRVTSIASGAFKNCTELATVTIPKGVTRIPSDAFRNCIDVTYVNFHEKVTYIGNGAFRGTSARGMILPESITFIDDNAFRDCDMEYFTIPKKVEFLGTSAFKDCNLLSSLIIDSSVMYIGSDAFNGCVELDELTVPISVDLASVKWSSIWSGCVDIKSIVFTTGTGIGYDYGGPVFDPGHNYGRTPMYYSRDSLTTVIFEEGITHIGSYLLSECYRIESLTIPKSVTSIGIHAFDGCTSLKEVTILGELTSIESFTFYDCKQLENVTIPQGVAYIGESAFENCTSLNEITIPKKVKSVDKFAFRSCGAITSLTILSDDLTFINQTFNDCVGLKELVVPISVDLASESSTHVWEDCTNIEKIIFTAGTGEGYDYGPVIGGGGHSYQRTPWYLSTDSLKTVVFEKGITKIGSYTLYGCHVLSSITIHEDIASIGNNAFCDCKYLKDITVSSSMEILPDEFEEDPGFSKFITSVKNDNDCCSLTTPLVTDVRSMSPISS